MDDESSKRRWLTNHQRDTIMDMLNILQGDIIELLGLQDLPTERKEVLLAQMTQVLQDRLIDRLIEAMSKEQQDAFSQMLAKDPKSDEVDAFLMRTVPTYVEMALEEAGKFKKELIDESAVVRQIAASALQAHHA